MLERFNGCALDYVKKVASEEDVPLRFFADQGVVFKEKRNIRAVNAAHNGESLLG